MANVRLARPEDADAIARAHVRAWQSAYRGLMPEAVLDALNVAERAERWRERLREEKAGHPTVLVVEDEDGAVAGFAAIGPRRGEPPGPSGELYAINLDPDCWGRGLGRALLVAAEEALREAGHDQAMLWVVAGNERARRFYELSGWVADGIDRRDRERGFELHEVRYAKRL